MKKLSLLLACCLIICLILTGCGGKNGDTPTVPDSTQSSNEQETANEPSNEGEKTDSAELKAPVLEWWELYNPNGIDTITGVMENTNDVAVDVSYDLVFYKEGAEVSRLEDFANFSILPHGRDILWANVNIPKSTDADDVKLENVIVTESAYPPIDGKYEYAGTTDGEVFFDFEFDSKPQLANITFLLYNDKNGNKQFDKGEIVVTSTDSLTEKTGRVSFEATGYDYTDYEVFFNAS